MPSGADGELPQTNGKLIIRNKTSSCLSELSNVISNSRSRYQVDLTGSVVSFNSSSFGIDATEIVTESRIVQ